MKVTCGTDIIEISRIKRSIEEIGDKFINKIFTEKEIEYCESKKAQKYQHYAVRFAAKEATLKAISCYLDNKYSISWKDIEVSNNKDGRPAIAITKSINGLDLTSIESMDISLSHCKEYAVANVTILGKD